MAYTDVNDPHGLVSIQKIIDNHLLIFQGLVILNKVSQLGQRMFWKAAHIRDITYTRVVLRHGDDFLIGLPPIDHLHNTNHLRWNYAQWYDGHLSEHDNIKRITVPT